MRRRRSSKRSRSISVLAGSSHAGIFRGQRHGRTHALTTETGSSLGEPHSAHKNGRKAKKPAALVILAPRPRPAPLPPDEDAGNGHFLALQDDDRARAGRHEEGSNRSGGRSPLQR